MDLFKQVLRNDGSMGIEHTFGNLRYDVTTGESPTFIVGDANGSAQTVIRPDGSLAQEWQFGGMRFSSDRQGFDVMM